MNPAPTPPDVRRPTETRSGPISLDLPRRRDLAGASSGALVTLVRPPVVTLPGSLATHGPVPPIGLAYLAAALRDAGYGVAVIDAPMIDADRVDTIDSPVGSLHRHGPDAAAIVERIDPTTSVLGITNMFLHEWPQVRAIAEAARAKWPDMLIVLGGETPTAFWTRIFAETDAVDCCVLGEGEATLIELLDRVTAGASLDGMDGVALHPARRDLGRPCAGLPTRLRRIDTVPWPAWDLFDLDAYWASTAFFGVDLGRSMPMLATRGCPYKCTFCSSPQMWTTRYVVRDPDAVADEIAHYAQRFGVRNINFCDLTAITKRQWTLDFCDALDARHLDITWQLPIGTRSEALDAEVLQRLWDTGCRNITYAPETGSVRMLRVMDKRVDLDHMLGSLRSAVDIGLKTHVNLIIGHPEERWSDLRASFGLAIRAARIGCHDLAPSIFAPYPGSRDYDQLVAAGAITEDEETCYVSFSRSTSASRSYNPNISARQLRIAQIALLATFYGLSAALHPSRLWNLVRTPFVGGETTYLEQMLRTRRQSRRAGQRSRRKAGISPGWGRRVGGRTAPGTGR